MWMQGFWIMLGCLPVDIYRCFFSLLPIIFLPQQIGGASWQRMSSAGPSEWHYSKGLAQKAKAVLPLVTLVWLCWEYSRQPLRGCPAVASAKPDTETVYKDGTAVWSSPWGSVICCGTPNPPLYVGCRCEWYFPTRGQFYHACISIRCWSHSTIFLSDQKKFRWKPWSAFNYFSSYQVPIWMIKPFIWRYTTQFKAGIEEQIFRCVMCLWEQACSRYVTVVWKWASVTGACVLHWE